MSARLNTLLFPHVPHVRVRDVIQDDQQIVLFATTRRASRCPRCRHRSTRIHSHYERVLRDVPCAGRAVILRLRARRFRCDVVRCPCRIFTERLPQLLAPRARRTLRAQEQLGSLGLALGGRPGARQATTLGLPVSARTLLRVLHRQPCPASGPVRILGVDDFAFRKGRRYGTILVDLESHRVVDLLPDRTAATVAAWLRQHPEVAVISRDRAGAYAEGARQGAPHALQIADRFHLVQNVTEALERYLARKHAALRQATQAQDSPAPAPPGTAAAPAVPTAVPSTRAEHEQHDRRARRLGRYEDVRALYAQGYSQRAIADQLALSRDTVQRFLQAGHFPERQPRAPQPTHLAPFDGYVRARWDAGCHNATRLWQEIRQQGFAGSRVSVATHVQPWRQRPAGGHGTATTALAPAAAATVSAAPRHVCWLLRRPEEERTAEERAYLARLYHLCPHIALAQALVQEFVSLVHDGDVPGLYQWLHGVEVSAMPEFVAIARGIWRDRQAVEAALTEAWSNGQVEGQVNRLKMLKRTMYGRAGFAFLRLRVLHAA